MAKVQTCDLAKLDLSTKPAASTAQLAILFTKNK